MKKITLIFAALALAFSVSAQFSNAYTEYGGRAQGEGSLRWSLEDNFWDEDVDPDETNVCAPITIAVEVIDPAIIDWLNGDRDNRYVAWSPFLFPGGVNTGFNWRSVNFNSRWGARFTRVSPESNIWTKTFTPSQLFTYQVTEGATITFSTPWSDVIARVGGGDGSHFYTVPGDAGTIIVEDGLLRMHGELFTVEFTGEIVPDDEGRDSREVVHSAWENRIDGISGPFPSSASFTIGPMPFFVVGGNCEVSIADVIADERELTVVAFYSLLGQRLQREPSSGIFIVRFCDGSTMKVAK